MSTGSDKPIAVAPDVSISLAAIEANQVVRIERLLLDSLEQLCEELGLHEGDVVQCRASSARRLYLATVNARTVAIDRDQARFVRVVLGTDRRTTSGDRQFSLP